MPTLAVGAHENGEKRSNSRPDDFRALTVPEVGVLKQIASTHWAILLVPYRKQNTGNGCVSPGSGYESPTAHGDVTNMAL